MDLPSPSLRNYQKDDMKRIINSRWRHLCTDHAWVGPIPIALISPQLSLEGIVYPIFTARVCSMAKVMFSLCVSVHKGGDAPYYQWHLVDVLELQGVCPLLPMTSVGLIWNYRGACTLLLMTPGGCIWNYRGYAPYYWWMDLELLVLRGAPGVPHWTLGETPGVPPLT